MFMKRNFFLILISVLVFPNLLKAQGGVPVYHDYLSDNLYLLHPATAGAGSCAKVRLTGRMQWFDVDDSPMLQTFSFNTHLGREASNGIGAIIYNDRNGYHSEKGLQLAYAHHLNFGDGSYVNKLSFGLAGSLVQTQLDETSFDPNRFDPIISGSVQSEMYYNLDAGFSYHFKGFFLNVTLKNLLLSSRNLYSKYESLNLRNYVASAGVYFGSKNFHLEPSVLVQYKEFSNQLITDTNLKFYFTLVENNMFYLGASYRRDWSADPYEYYTLSPIVGANFGKFTMAYTYTYDMSPLLFSNSGFHQITLGYNFNCRKQVVRMGCPEIF